jgi:hypothetical protein
MSATAKIEGDNLIFELHGIDKILAIKREITVPLNHVVSVSTQSVAWKPFTSARANLSTHLFPGLVKVGDYLTRDGMMFFQMHHPDKCVTVTLDDEKYRKIIFEVEDKQSVAKAINQAIRRTRK